MTTTAFRKNKNEACMASDSRTSWIEPKKGYMLKWFDSPDYRKTITIDDVMYGFAGANVIYKLFLMNYTDRDSSLNVLDLLVELAKRERVQFSILRFDGEALKLIAYSPEDDFGNPEIYKISGDEPLNTNIYAIGSGKDSKMYKKHRSNEQAQAPVYKIIAANNNGLKKATCKRVMSKISKGHVLTEDESWDLFGACKNKGGDLFTGGKVNMSKNASKADIDRQVMIMDQMDKQAKAAGAVCASPINAALEKKNLESLGHSAVSDRKVKIDSSNIELFNLMKEQLKASI